MAMEINARLLSDTDHCGAYAATKSGLYCRYLSSHAALMDNSVSQHVSPSPRHIAAGLGDSSRQEVCGLLAMLEATMLPAMVGAMGEAAWRKLTSGDKPTSDRVSTIAQELLKGPLPTDVLRARLWLNVKEALGLPDLYPLSTRFLEVDAAALGLRAAQILAPAVLNTRQEQQKTECSILGRATQRLQRTFTGAHKREIAAITFPDVVAHELTTLMAGLVQAGDRGELDPEVAEAVLKGQQAISKALVAGGGWVAFASAIGSAGFAPYIVAAKLSAIIPFVTGPMLTSLLFVMINPVTMIAGSAALGYWAINGQASAAREVAGARIAILLAVRGLGAEHGAARLLTAFRGLHRMATKDLNHLSQSQLSALREQAAVSIIAHSAEIPPAPWPAPGLWGAKITAEQATERQDTAIIAALTAGDILYHAAAIDPAVLAAADFSRVTEFDTALDLAAHVADFAAQGAQIALRGYTAEQLVMAQLIETGHDVKLAVGSTTPGYDLIVDDCPVQIKCGTNISILHEHFAKYPDIPVIADNALAAQAQALNEPWAPMVTTLNGFDLTHVQSLVDKALGAAAELSDMGVPLYATIVGGARAAHKAWTGQIPIEDLPAWLILDLTIRGGLAGAGQAGGALLGLVVLGPAGALILGPIAGVAALLGTGQAHDLVDQGIRSEWRAEVLQAAQALQTSLMTACDRQISSLKNRLERLRGFRREIPHQLFTWLEARMLDDLIAAIEARDRIPTPTDIRSAMELLVQASRAEVVAPEVLHTRHRLARHLEAKPSIATASMDLGSKLYAAFRKRSESDTDNT